MQSILYITTKSEVGGVQKFVQEQIEISSEVYDVYLCSNKEGWLNRQVESKVKSTFLSKSIERKISIFFN